MERIADYDVAIIGGGPAGLSAALILARCCRRVLLLDDGKPRNSNATKLHGFITRDGIDPAEFLALARRELETYDNVVYLHTRVERLAEKERHFIVAAADKDFTARRVLIATGVVDKWPPIEGAAPFFGKSIHHCPYCDAWEVRDRPLGVYGRGTSALRLALNLLAWTDDVQIFTDGGDRLCGADEEIAARHGIRVHTEKILRLEGSGGLLSAVVHEGGDVPISALFFATDTYERLALAEQLGCTFSDEGCIRTEKHRTTSVEGVFAAGDVTRDVQFVIMAAGQGAQAATGINLSLLKEDLKRAGTIYPE